MAWYETDTPPRFEKLKEFGSICYYYPKAPDERSNTDMPWISGIYLYPSSYSPFTYRISYFV
jgi:hypothetical protein